MAYSALLYTGNGVTIDWNVTFDYLDQSHVKVAVGKVLTTAPGSLYDFEWIDSTTIRVRTIIDDLPVPNGTEVKVFRQTPIATPAVVFGGGSSLTSANLNKNSEYLTYALQEATDANEEFTKLYLGSLPAAPTTDNDGDALQVGAVYYDSTVSALYYWTGSQWIIGESTAAAEAARVAAEAARDATLAAQASAVASINAEETSALSAVSAAQAAAQAAIAADVATAEAAIAADVATADASATAAAASASTASGSATAAQAAQAAAEQALDDFTDLYLGAFAAAPTLDNDGNPLAAGAQYFNTVTLRMNVYNGATWSELVGGGGLFKGNNGTSGSQPGDIFRVNSQTLTSNTTIDASENASAAGPVTVGTGVTLTVNGNLAIV